MKVLYASTHCVLDGSSTAAKGLRALLEGLAARGHDVRVLCGSLLDAPEGVALLERAPQAGSWTGGPNAGSGAVRAGTLRGVRYRILCFGSNRTEDLLAKEAQVLFLALLDVERTWPPQALITGGDDLFARLLQRRARSRDIPCLGWPADMRDKAELAAVEAALGLARSSD